MSFLSDLNPDNLRITGLLTCKVLGYGTTNLVMKGGEITMWPRRNLETLKEAAEVIIILTAVAYALGFLVHTIYLGRYGVGTYDVLRIRYIHIGAVLEVYLLAMLSGAQFLVVVSRQIYDRKVALGHRLFGKAFLGLFALPFVSALPVMALIGLTSFTLPVPGPTAPWVTALISQQTVFLAFLGAVLFVTVSLAAMVALAWLVMLIEELWKNQDQGDSRLVGRVCLAIRDAWLRTRRHLTKDWRSFVESTFGFIFYLTISLLILIALSGKAGGSDGFSVLWREDLVVPRMYVFGLVFNYFAISFFGNLLDRSSERGKDSELIPPHEKLEQETKQSNVLSSIGVTVTAAFGALILAFFLGLYAYFVYPHFPVFAGGGALQEAKVVFAEPALNGETEGRQTLIIDIGRQWVILLVGQGEDARIVRVRASSLLSISSLYDQQQ